MAKKKPASDNRQRYERLFDEIYDGLDSSHAATRSIVRALEIVAMELSELNVGMSKLMEESDGISTLIHHAERIDAQTDEVAAVHRQRPGKNR